MAEQKTDSTTAKNRIWFFGKIEKKVWIFISSHIHNADDHWNPLNFLQHGKIDFKLFKLIVKKRLILHKNIFGTEKTNPFGSMMMHQIDIIFYIDICPNLYRIAV